MAKQAAQREVFINTLNTKERWRSKYHNKRIITTLNDVNTKVENRSLTKTKLQKEGDLTPKEYELLVRASMKYLLAEANNLLKDELTWDKLTSNMDELKAFDKRVDD